MSKDKVIHLLEDEQISLLLTGLRLVSIKEPDVNIDLIDDLYELIESCEDMGVINDEKI